MVVNTARKKRKIEKRRREILETAKQLFLSRSYLDVTVDEIADAADISKATIYSYFENKSEIYSAVTIADAETMVASMQNAIKSESDTRSNLHALAWSYIRFFFANPEYFEKLSWFYFPGREKHLSRTQIEAVGARFDLARGIIAKCLTIGIKRGELRRIDVKTAATTIYSQWLGIVYLAVASKPSRNKWIPNVEKAIVFSIDMQLKGLLKP